MVECRPVPSVTNLHRWEVDCVEIYVVLSHELVEMDVLGIEPPLLPFGCEVRCDAKIAYRGFELEAIRRYIIMARGRRHTQTSVNELFNERENVMQATHKGPFPSYLGQGRHPTQGRGHPTSDLW
jgi:hypothetical protein